MPGKDGLRSYIELQYREAFLFRFRYLKLDSQIGIATFGYDRYLNQAFYSSNAWKKVLNEVLVRDDGLDLGVQGHAIFSQVHVHHMNPITLEDLKGFNPDILNPEYLICVSTQTHNAIHFGDEKQLPRPFVERTPGDTDLW